MPITGLDLVTVTGKYYKMDGTSATGTVTFTPSTVLKNTAADEIIYPFPFVVNLDASGSFSVQLPATDDPDIEPNDWSYVVTESIVGSSATRTYDLTIPYNGGPINLADRPV